MKFLSVLLFTISLGFQAYCQSNGLNNNLSNSQEGSATNPLLSEQEIALRTVVKKKLYLGGKDEEPIKVQAQLPLVTRKQGPTQEIEAPEEATTHDAD